MLTSLLTNDSFEEFHMVPFASASLAQVHKAKLKNGEWVAVKVCLTQVLLTRNRFNTTEWMNDSKVI